MAIINDRIENSGFGALRGVRGRIKLRDRNVLVRLRLLLVFTLFSVANDEYHNAHNEEN